MSALFKIKIFEKSNNNVVQFRVFIIHPDVNEVPVNKTFPLNLLVDFWFITINGYFFPKESKLPIPKKKLQQIAKLSKDKELMDKLLVLAHGEKLIITKEEHNEIAKSGEFVYQGKKIASYGEENGIFAVTFNPDDKLFKAEADLLVKKIEINDRKNFPWAKLPETFEKVEDEEIFWENYYKLENVPQATVTTWFSEKLSLDFIFAKSEWETAVWF